MRTFSWTRWAACALAITVAVPVALADHGTTKIKSISSCTTFDQADKGEDAVELNVQNCCAAAIECTVSWQVTCIDAKKHKTTHPSEQKLSVTEGTSQSTDASAAVCGDQSWSIDAIQWSCQPPKD